VTYDDRVPTGIDGRCKIVAGIVSVHVRMDGKTAAHNYPKTESSVLLGVRADLCAMPTTLVDVEHLLFRTRCLLKYAQELLAE